MTWSSRWFGPLLLAGAIGCTADEASSATSARRPEVRDLPQPRVTGPRSLEETLARRRSVRAFTGEALTPEQVAQLLWAAQGLTRQGAGRTAPSAGALYPLEVYVVSAGHVGHYVATRHQLEVLAQDDRRAALAQAALGQSAVADAATVFVIAGVVERTTRKYGPRALRYVLLEAGHACQNLLLEAVALDLGAVPVGAFDDARVQRVLGLPRTYEPLYLVPVGHPK